MLLLSPLKILIRLILFSVLMFFSMEKSLQPFHKRWPNLVRVIGMNSVRLLSLHFPASELQRLEDYLFEPEDIINDIADSSVITY